MIYTQYLKIRKKGPRSKIGQELFYLISLKKLHLLILIKGELKKLSHSY